MTESDLATSTSSNPGGVDEFIVIEHTADPNGPPAPDAQLTAVDRLLLFRMAQAEFSMRVVRITDADWDRPTPCADWTVADLVRHLVSQHRGVSPRLAGDDADAATDDAGEVGADEDLISAWLEAANASSDAFGAEDALAGQVGLSKDATPATDYLADLTGELAIHGWDLGRALGDLAQLPDALARPVWERFREHGDLSGSKDFGPPVPVDAGASYTDRLVGQAGRDRYWAAPSR